MSQMNNTMSDEMQKALDVQSRYQEYLMRKPHVLGIAVGYATQSGVATSEIALIVLVDQKIPPQELSPDARIPSRLEGVRVDVQETGTLTAFDAGSAQ
jgi:hypothetical protein